MLPADPIAAATDGDPYDFYAQLVAERPLYYDERLRLWVAASAAAVMEVLANPLCRVRPLREPVPQPIVGSVAGDVFGNLVRMNDGERHRALKRAVSIAFENMPLPTAERASVESARCLATSGSPGSHGTDVTAFAFRFPVHVMAVLLDIPDDQLSDVAGATDAFTKGISPLSSVEQRARGCAAAERLQAIVQPLVSGTPTATLFGAFRRAADREALDDETVIANGIGFLFQTCEATAGLIGNTLVTLGRHPDLLELVTREPHHLRPMIEEVLRFDPPVQNTRRFVAAPVVVAGEPMQPGEAVLVLLAAANRDPAANADPGRFDVFRTNRRLFTFGAGPHACPGSMLAVTIAAAGVGRLLQDGLDPGPLAHGFTYRRSVNVRIPLFRSLPTNTAPDTY